MRFEPLGRRSRAEARAASAGARGTATCNLTLGVGGHAPPWVSTVGSPGMLMVVFCGADFWGRLFAWLNNSGSRSRVDIKLPPTERWYIEPKPLITAIPQIPLHNRAGCAHAPTSPGDERSLRNSAVFDFQVWGLHQLAVPRCRQGPPTNRRRPACGVDEAGLQAGYVVTFLIHPTCRPSI